MFRLEMLPVGDGDCLILSWGEESAPRHMLIDGGLPRSSGLLGERLRHLSDSGGRLELLIVTHIDADHIGGILGLCESGKFPVQVEEVWFNGFEQLSGARPMSMNQADRLSLAIKRQVWALNQSFSGRSVKVADDGAPVEIVLAGGLKLTVLSPDSRSLTRLRHDWDRYRAELDAELAASKSENLPAGVRSMSPSGAGSLNDLQSLADRPEEPDSEVANGSSIAFLAEYQGSRVLMAADAHPDTLCSSIQRLPLNKDGRLEVDLIKVSHHGSRHNTTRELAKLLRCGSYAISASGLREGRPAIETVAKLLVYALGKPRRLYFNHSGKENKRWANEALGSLHDLTCEFPAEGRSCLIDMPRP